MAHFRPEHFPALHVAFVENVAGKGFDFIRYIPSLVVGNAFVDVIQQQRQDRRSRSKAFDEAVHGIGQHLVAVQFDVQIRAKLKFAGQVAHDRLEERVDGLHPEAAVVVQHIQQGVACPLPDFLFGERQVQC